MNRTYAFAYSYVNRSVLLVCISEKAPDDDARARERVRRGAGKRVRETGREREAEDPLTAMT